MSDKVIIPQHVMDSMKTYGMYEVNFGTTNVEYLYPELRSFALSFLEDDSSEVQKFYEDFPEYESGEEYDEYVVAELYNELYNYVEQMLNVCHLRMATHPGDGSLVYVYPAISDTLSIPAKVAAKLMDSSEEQIVSEDEFVESILNNDIADNYWAHYFSENDNNDMMLFDERKFVFDDRIDHFIEECEKSGINCRVEKDEEGKSIFFFQRIEEEKAQLSMKN